MIAAGNELKAISSHAIGPSRVAGDLRQHLEAVHELDHAAGLEALMRIGEARPIVFVAGETAAGELAVNIHHLPVIPLGPLEEFFVRHLLRINRRLAKRLGDVHVVPVMNAGGPILHVVVNVLGQLQQKRIARAVVKPVGGFRWCRQSECAASNRGRKFPAAGVLSHWKYLVMNGSTRSSPVAS